MVEREGGSDIVLDLANSVTILEIVLVNVFTSRATKPQGVAYSETRANSIFQEGLPAFREELTFKRPINPIRNSGYWVLEPCDKHAISRGTGRGLVLSAPHSGGQKSEGLFQSEVETNVTRHHQMLLRVECININN